MYICISTHNTRDACLMFNVFQMTKLSNSDSESDVNSSLTKESSSLSVPSVES